MAATERSDTNPYGNEGFSIFKNTNYAQPDVGGLTLEGIATLNRQAYDKFKNPFAKRSIFGQDVGGDMLRGKLRSDIRPGTLTRYGMTEEAPSKGGFFSGIANLIPVIGAAMRMNRPATLPGFGDDFVLSNLERLGPTLGTSTEPNINTGFEEKRSNVGSQTSSLPSASGNINESVILEDALGNTDAGDFFRQQYRFSEAPQINPDSQLAFNLNDPDGPYSLRDLVLGPPGLGDQALNDFDAEFFKNYASTSINPGDQYRNYIPTNRATRQNLSGIADVAARLYGLKPLVDAPLGDNSYLTIEGRFFGGKPEGGIYYTKKF
jgi:hypothetical protein